MTSWLRAYAPRRFDELATTDAVRELLAQASLTANPPHLLLSGPSGVGKTAAWRLVARQVLGPGWRSTTHVLNARDLARTSGAMATFESFLRPEGRGSSDTLAGRTSLEAFDVALFDQREDDAPPAGEESVGREGRQAVSRLIVIEDADHLGPKRQPYLRRMMESGSGSSRFLFTARTPSRLIDAIRSRVQHVRMPPVSREQIVARLEHACAQAGADDATVLEDVAHVVSGDLRRALFVTELLVRRGLHTDRNALGRLLQETEVVEMRMVIEEALRGRLHDWRWEKQGARNTRVLYGAMGHLDRLMNAHHLEGDQVIEHVHQHLVEGRFHLPPAVLAELLEVVAKTDADLRRSSTARIHLEAMLHRFADVGRRAGFAPA